MDRYRYSTVIRSDENQKQILIVIQSRSPILSRVRHSDSDVVVVRRQLHQGTILLASNNARIAYCTRVSSLQSPFSSHLESISSVSSGSINFFSSSFPLFSFVPLLLIFGAQLICLSFLSTRSFHQRSLQLHFIITLLLPPPPPTKNKKTNGHFTPRY